MLSPEILDQNEFTFTQGDFVNVDLFETSPGIFRLDYRFQVYMNVHLALIKEFDEIEARITERSETKVNYFTDDTTPDGVVNSVTGFIQRSKATLVEERKRIQIASTTVKTSQFLDDTATARIGSGRITEENYELFLPTVDVVKAGTQATGSSTYSYDDQRVSKIARNVFTTFSIHPTEIFQTTGAKKLAAGRPEIRQFVDFLEIGSEEELRLRSESRKQKYKPCMFRMSIENLSENSLLEIMAKRTLYLELVFFRKGVAKLKTRFLFQNRKEIEATSLAVKDLGLEVIPAAGSRGRDIVRVSNKNPFDVKYLVEQRAYVNQSFVVTKVGSGVLASKSDTRLTSKIDFGNPTESRCYTVTAVRDLPFTSNNARIMSCVSIPSARKVSRESIKLEAYVELFESSARIVTKNVPDFVDSIKVTRKQKGFTSSVDIGLFEPNSSVFDEQIVDNTDYIYIFRFLALGAEVLEKIEVPFRHLVEDKQIVNVNFALALSGVSAAQDQITHQITISETRTNSVGASLQDEITSAGLSDKFDEEREDNKSQYSFTTRYKIARINTTTGQSETLPNSFTPGNVTLNFNGDPSHGYRYLVRLLASNTAAVSYLTVVTKRDIGTGNSYKFRFRKWRSAATNRDECVPSQQQILRNSLEEGVEIGGLGKQLTLEVPSNIQVPSVTDFDVQQDEANGANYISWNVSGDISEIDHFILFAFHNGTERVIGTASPQKFEESKPYLFSDRKYSGKIGEVSYRIAPVFRGLTIKPPSSYIVVNRSASVPERSLLRGKT